MSVEKQESPNGILVELVQLPNKLTTGYALKELEKYARLGLRSITFLQDKRLEARGDREGLETEQR